MKSIILCCCLLVLGGCKSLPWPDRQQSATGGDLCQSNTGLHLSDQPCDLLNWMAYRQQSDQLPWAQRRQRIDKLADSHIDQLKMILLSQPMDTPYQSRLRAQNALADIQPYLTPRLTRLINVWVQQPSQKLLEYESALVTVSKINARQAQTIDEQKQRIDDLQQSVQQQKDQIQQLMKIESSLSHKESSNEAQ